MGMFDSVMVTCPNCYEDSEFQSKSGDCFLEVYTLEDCPEDVLSDVNRHSPHKCSCGINFEVSIPHRKVIEVS